MPPKHLRYRWRTVWKTKWTCHHWNGTPAKTWFTSWACHKYKPCITCSFYQWDTNWRDTNHPQKPTKPNLLTKVQEMKAELVAIRKSIGNQHRTTTPDQYRFRNEERARPRECSDYLRVLREGFGDRCTHCFVGGVVISTTILGDHKLKTGHISRETDWSCTQRTGSNPEYAQTVPNMCKMWENRRCYRSTPSLFTMPCQLVLFKLCQQEHWGEHKIQSNKRVGNTEPVVRERARGAENISSCPLNSTPAFKGD